MLDRKQIELLGGGYYEPAFNIIPQADRISQTELQTNLIRQIFGKRVRGCLLPSMLWDPSLIPAFASSGIEYTFLSCNQFSLARVATSDMVSPFITEEQGRVLSVFPLYMHKDLPNPFKEYPGFLKALSLLASTDEMRIISIIPEIHTVLDDRYEQKERTFEGFFKNILAEQDLIQSILPARAMKLPFSVKKAFFPNSAEAHLMACASNTAAKKGNNENRGRDKKNNTSNNFTVSGILPRQFLLWYPASMNIYSKMNHMHVLVNQLRGDKARKQNAREEILKAQGLCNFISCSGHGIYSNSLRKGAYRSLINAEKIYRQRQNFEHGLVSKDYSFNGKNSFLFQGNNLNAYVSLLGGSVFEIDYLAKSWNYADSMERRIESWSAETAVEDVLPRTSFLDILMSPETNFEKAQNDVFNSSRLCCNENYRDIEVDRKNNYVVLSLAPNPKHRFGSIEIIKRICLVKNSLKVNWSLLNTGNSVERFNFASRLELSFASELATELRGLRENGEEKLFNLPADLNSFIRIQAYDKENDVKINIQAERSINWWVYPVKTCTKVKNSLGQAYQSTSISPVYSLVLAPGESWATGIQLDFQKA